MPFILPNVMFGVYALVTKGWLFMLAIIVLECLFLSRFLQSSWWDNRIALFTFIANVVSGSIGFAGSLLLTGGWWLVVWFPWVSQNEIRTPGDGLFFMAYYLVAFVLSVLIEGFIQLLALNRRYPTERIVTGIIYANLLSYALGSLLMYSFSFGVFN
jgi:hypothetical protein